MESKIVDGKEKFFLYFANNGAATGVIVGDSPVGPWRDERGSLLITGATPGASNGVNWLFDPGVFIDDDGQGYLYFGGGGDDNSDSYENTNHPKSTRVIKLGDDMTTHRRLGRGHRRAAHVRGGPRLQAGGQVLLLVLLELRLRRPDRPRRSPTGAIAYMVADHPMGPWTADKYTGVIFRNPGNFFGAGGNNHQSVFQLDGEYYFTYHAQTLNRRITGNATQGFRSPHIAKLEFNRGRHDQGGPRHLRRRGEDPRPGAVPRDRGRDDRLAAGHRHQEDRRLLRRVRRAGPEPGAARRRQRRLDLAGVGRLR